MTKATDAMRRRNIKHGHAQVGKTSPEYRAWTGMLKRTTNPNDKAFPNYGGRGITINDDWKVSFISFLADVGPRPSPAHTIDRIDNNKGYFAANVRWATKKEQSRNRRLRPLTIDGVTRLLCEWSDISHLPLRLIWQRLYVLGWHPAKAVYYPQRRLLKSLGMTKPRGHRG